VLPYQVFTRHDIAANMETVIEQAESLSSYPLFTKPVNLGSSVGITKCRGRGELYEGLMDAARYDRRVMVEQGLQKPREVEVSVLGNEQPKASLPGEVVPSDEFYSYNAKYIDESSQLLIPAPLPEPLREEIRSLAVRSYQAVDAAGMARVDFLLDRATDQVYVSEINTIPGFTRISMYPKLWEATGLSYSA
jgi:D-alanine-D-alanine ligase